MDPELPEDDDEEIEDSDDDEDDNFLQYHTTILRRLLISLLVGVAMAVMTYLCAWFEMRDATGYRWPHERTYQTLRTLQTALDEEHKTHQSYPAKLDGLKEAHAEWIRFEETDEVLDGWERPIQYQPTGNAYALFSLGRDGRPGGSGLDADLNVGDLPTGKESIYPLPPVGIPTLWQFTFDFQETRGVFLGCGLAGLFAAVACFSSWPKSEKKPIFSLIKLACTLAACLLVTLTLTVIHIPSHH